VTKLSEQHTCRIEYLKRLKESSREAVENTDYFSDFNEYMHIKRPVEDELLELLKKQFNQKNRNSYYCGGVGDGKSHIIAYLKNTHPDLLNKFNIHNDATESFQPTKTSLETLNEFLDDFSDERIDVEGNWVNGEVGVRHEVSRKSRNNAYIFALIDKIR
jgi:DNA phosphorothioation-dependent restriction protein DptF